MSDLIKELEDQLNLLAANGLDDDLYSRSIERITALEGEKERLKKINAERWELADVNQDKADGAIKRNIELKQANTKLLKQVEGYREALEILRTSSMTDLEMRDFIREFLHAVDKGRQALPSNIELNILNGTSKLERDGVASDPFGTQALNQDTEKEDESAGN